LCEIVIFKVADEVAIDHGRGNLTRMPGLAKLSPAAEQDRGLAVQSTESALR